MDYAAYNNPSPLRPGPASGRGRSQQTSDRPVRPGSAPGRRPSPAIGAGPGGSDSGNGRGRGRDSDHGGPDPEPDVDYFAQHNHFWAQYAGSERIPNLRLDTGMASGAAGGANGSRRLSRDSLLPPVRGRPSSSSSSAAATARPASSSPRPERLNGIKIEFGHSRGRSQSPAGAGGEQRAFSARRSSSRPSSRRGGSGMPQSPAPPRTPRTPLTPRSPRTPMSPVVDGLRALGSSIARGIAYVETTDVVVSDPVVTLAGNLVDRVRERRAGRQREHQQQRNERGTGGLALQMCGSSQEMPDAAAPDITAAVRANDGDDLRCDRAERRRRRAAAEIRVQATTSSGAENATRDGRSNGLRTTRIGDFLVGVGSCSSSQSAQEQHNQQASPRGSPKLARFRDASVGAMGRLADGVSQFRAQLPSHGGRRGSGDFFSDVAPFGTMEACVVCGEPPVGMLTQGKCKQCLGKIRWVKDGAKHTTTMESNSARESENRAETDDTGSDARPATIATMEELRQLYADPGNPFADEIDGRHHRDDEAVCLRDSAYYEFYDEVLDAVV